MFISLKLFFQLIILTAITTMKHEELRRINVGLKDVFGQVERRQTRPDRIQAPSVASTLIAYSVRRADLLIMTESQSDRFTF